MLGDGLLEIEEHPVTAQGHNSTRLLALALLGFRLPDGAAVAIESGPAGLERLKLPRHRGELDGCGAGPQLLAYLLKSRVQPADCLIEGPEQQLEDDGRCLKATLVQLGCTV